MVHKIDTPGATAEGTFSNGNPALGTDGTQVDADWLNGMQGDVLAVYGAAQIDPVKGLDLLPVAISTMITDTLGELLVQQTQVAVPYPVGQLDFMRVGEAMICRALAPATSVGQVIDVQLAGRASAIPIQVGVAWAIGDRIYWDDSLRLMTPVPATGRVFAGLALTPGFDSTAVVTLRFQNTGEGPLS
ncbi:MAG: capsid cement protein [Planctomycetota bacterium]